MITEPPAEMEEEFNAWYDAEHLPERLAIPGFRSARRWVADCRPGEGKYLATYELDSAAVLASPRYLSFFERPTAWSQRCLGKAVLFKRWACEQVEPGDAECDPRTAALILNGLHPAALQIRRFRSSTGEAFVLTELADPSITPASGLVYRRYRT